MMKETLLLLVFILLAITFDAASQATTTTLGPATEIMNRINDVVCLILNIIQYVASGVAALMIILAGMRFLSSGDDPAERNKAKNMIIYAFAGLTIVIIACPAVDYIIEGTGIVPFSQSCNCLFGGGNTTASAAPQPCIQCDDGTNCGEVNALGQLCSCTDTNIDGVIDSCETK